MWQVPRGIGKGLDMEQVMLLAILVLSVTVAVLIKAADWCARDASRWRIRYHEERRRRIALTANPAPSENVKGEAPWVLE